jgi:hypothetical protein
MKTIQGIALALALIIASVIQSLAVVDQAIEIQGTNIVLSWPSQGYEYYMIQYWPDLSAPSIQLTNCYPANSTNRTTLVIPCCTMAALGGGDGGTNGGGSIEPPGAMTTSAAITSDESDWGSDLWVVQSDGSETPLKLYPPGVDTNGMILTDTPPPGSESESAPSFSANSFGGAAETPDGITNGGCDCPSYGFFRVWHIPDWLADVTNFVFDGPTFIPVDFKDYVDEVDTISVLIDGQETPNAQFMPFTINAQTNWGMGIYFDRFPNGTHTIQLISTLRLSDTLDDNTSYLVLSNLTRTITVGNTITFTNWDYLILSNTYTFQAQSMITNVNWEIDIFDANNNFVNSQTDSSSDGNIQWIWDLTDYTGASRVDDSDPFFFAEVSVTPQAGGSTTTRFMPALANQFPSKGSWVFAYMDKFFDDGSTNYPTADSIYNPAIQNMEGGPSLWNIAAFDSPLKFGTNYAQSERDDSWNFLDAELRLWPIRNFYYFGHGAPNNIGGDISVTDSSNNITGAKILLPNSHAYLTSSWVRDNVTFDKAIGPIPFRFVWLDGCSTAATNGNWPAAWGVPKQVEPLSYYTSTNNVTHARPSAFAGWDVNTGGNPGWGTIEKFWQFRQFWMGNWSVQSGQENDGLRDVFDQALAGSNWVDSGHYSHLKIFGYKDMKFLEYNHAGDWPQ